MLYGSRGNDDVGLLDAMGVPPEIREKMREAATVEIWPENWQAFTLFMALGTQWRTGMNGPTGLDYAAIPAVMDMQGIQRKGRDELFEQIRLMEAEALSVMAERNSRN